MAADARERQTSLFARDPGAPETATQGLAPGERSRVDEADAVTWLQGLPSGSVDLVLTDPAYESLEKHRAIGTTTRLKKSKGSSNEWFPIFPNARFPELFAELYRVLRKNAHCYVMCDQETMFLAKPIAESVGFKFWKALVWHKTGGIGMGYHYRAQHEMILFLEKGKRKLASLSVPDVLSVKRAPRGFPTEKPVPLLRILVTQSSAPGEIVCDPFSGSGATGVAALGLDRRYLGCDLKPEAVAESRRRIFAVGVP